MPYVFDLMFGSMFEGVGRGVRQTFILHFRLPSINRWDEDNMKTLHFAPTDIIRNGRSRESNSVNNY